jgi:hypothetical protein
MNHHTVYPGQNERYSSVDCQYYPEDRYNGDPRPCFLWQANYGSYTLAWGCDATQKKPTYQQTETFCYWYNYGEVSGRRSGAAKCVQPSRGCSLSRDVGPALHLLCSQCWQSCAVYGVDTSANNRDHTHVLCAMCWEWPPAGALHPDHPVLVAVCNTCRASQQKRRLSLTIMEGERQSTVLRTAYPTAWLT